MQWGDVDAYATVCVGVCSSVIAQLKHVNHSPRMCAYKIMKSVVMCEDYTAEFIAGPG